MGRLTLNVLLSFAQFEREVTGERIRDKIAASKRKGIWMGGVVPLGYRVENRKLSSCPRSSVSFGSFLALPRSAARAAQRDLLERGIVRAIRTYGTGKIGGITFMSGRSSRSYVTASTLGG